MVHDVIQSDKYVSLAQTQMPDESYGESMFPLLKTQRLMPLLLALLVAVAAACGSGAAGEPAAGNGADRDENEAKWLNEEGEVDLAAMFPETEDEAPVDRVEEAAPVSTAVTVEAGAEPPTNDEEIPMGFLEDGHAYIGHLDAPIVMEEFSDFQCPYCSRFAAQTLPHLLQNQIAAGEVRLVYYDFPLRSIHPQAEGAAVAARCAGEQGAAAYWDFHDLLFSRADAWSNNRAETVFVEFAAEMGLDGTDFESCLQSGRYRAAVQADVDEGITRGVNSTPSFFLNDQPLIGAHPVETFNQAITALLNGESIAAAQPQTAPPEPVIPTPALVPVTEETIAFAMGDPEAPVTIVEYTDYQCPFCQRHAAETLPRMITEMVENGRVYYVMKDFPLEQIHPEARSAHKAARCAGEQDAYLEMHDALFNGQSRWAGRGGGTGQVYAEMAEEIGLDVAQFNTCTLGRQHDAAIQANLDEGRALSVTGTPSFFINGFLMSGAQPYEYFDQVVVWAENGELQAQIEASFRAAYEQQLAQQQQQQQQQPPQPTGPVDVPIEGSPAIGDPNAPIVIVEYTDYQCPYCSRHFAQTFPLLKENYIDTGVVYYVFKDFPLTSIHPQAALASEAARCAGEQNAYLEMHDMLFANQNEWNGNNEAAAIFTGYAEAIGLEPTPFSQCLESGQFTASVNADLQEGIGFGVRGTPSFFINGNPLVGAQPYDVFVQAITNLQNQ